MLKAINDRIIIRLDKNMAKSSIISVNEVTPNTGIVISIGNKVLSVKSGQHVVFHNFDELPLPQDGLVVIREKSLLAVYDD